MSRRTFQSAVARLVTDPDYRAGVRARGDAALEGDFSALERRRLLAAASDRGMDMTRTLHKAFRLGKLLTQLPLTCRLLGTERMAREVERFWKVRLPLSFYFLEEAIAFCDYLLAREPSEPEVEHLEEVVRYERAAKVLKKARFEGLRPEPERVEFGCDPGALLGALSRGETPGAVDRLACTLEARLTDDGEVEWDVIAVEGSAVPAPAAAAASAAAGS